MYAEGDSGGTRATFSIEDNFIQQLDGVQEERRLQTIQLFLRIQAVSRIVREYPNAGAQEVECTRRWVCVHV